MQPIQASGFQPSSNSLAITLQKEALVEWCDRWKVQELYLFGSVVRDDFRPENSDIDVMVTFLPEASWGFEFVSMKQELEKLLVRKVDLLTKASVEKSENWIRRQEILETAKLVYVAG
ncbi:MAG: nucleotidyltransferase domain-containing protein [Cyanobacteria bacterium P01_A01_bin.15]